MALTDTAVKAAKPGESKKKLSDGQGLQLWIMPTGSKSWALAYRFGEKQKSLALGVYPGVSLKDARQRRDEAKALLAQGIDPAQQRKLDKVTARQDASNTFAIVATELLDKKRREGKASNTIGKRERLYSLAGDEFGKRPLTEITAPEVLSVLRKIEAKGHAETARRLRSSIGEVFRFGVATGRCAADVTQSLRGALATPVVRHRAAITDAREFGALLRAIEAFNGQPTSIAGLKLLALTALRPGELRQAKWSEIDFEKAAWVIPASRMKMRRPHAVPLPKQALLVLEWLQAITGRGELIFQGFGKSATAGGTLEPKPISENTLNIALRRMGYTPEQATSHGFRTSFSTMANESGLWSSDAIERQLAHADNDGIRSIYSRGGILERARQAGPVVGR